MRIGLSLVAVLVSDSAALAAKRERLTAIHR